MSPRRALLFSIWLSALTACLACVAHAQYYPPMHSPKMSEPAKSDRLLQDWTPGRMDDLGWTFTCEAEYVFRVEPGMLRMFAQFPLDRINDYDMEFEGVREFLFEDSRSAEPVTNYLVTGAPLFVGKGKYFASGLPVDVEIFNDVIFTFTVDNDGNTTPIDLIGSSRYWMLNLFVLDINGDGLLDIAATSSWGVSGGGGVDLVTILPDGTFRSFWTYSEFGPRHYYPPVIQSTLESSYAVASMVDFDRDGKWEIETREYLTYGGNSGSYTYCLLWRLDEGLGAWLPCTSRFSKQYAEQDEFYRALHYAMTELPIDHEKFMWANCTEEQFSWTYMGKERSVHYFPWIDGEVLLPIIGNWDAYPAGTNY